MNPSHTWLEGSRACVLAAQRKPWRPLISDMPSFALPCRGSRRVGRGSESHQSDHWWDSLVACRPTLRTHPTHAFITDLLPFHLALRQIGQCL